MDKTEFEIIMETLDRVSKEKIPLTLGVFNRIVYFLGRTTEKVFELEKRIVRLENDRKN